MSFWEIVLAVAIAPLVIPVILGAIGGLLVLIGAIMQKVTGK